MIALLPLDDRPCNTRFPQEIAEIGGDFLSQPSRALLGRFNTPAEAAPLQEWLENLPEVEALIVSIDMLAYGGLVASRKTQTSLETAQHRLHILEKWRQTRPQTPVYAFNVLMRLAITMDSDAAVPHYYNVMRYARLVDEAARDPQKMKELQEVKAQIPTEILAEYQIARARNHAINLAMVDYLARGTFDYFLVTQEDCTEFGLHRSEQAEITARAKQLNVEARFALHPGADEAALTLLARHWKSGISFEIHWSDESRKRDIAVFEDVPYEDALHSHIEAMGGNIAQSNGDFQLFVNAPVGGSQKDETREEKAVREADLSAFCDSIERALSEKKRVALCDVAFPNGADELLLSLLQNRGILGQLSVFGGWNTAGNTTGTVLAQCAALFRAGDAESVRLNRRFVFERLVDDWGYQARVRSQVEKTARERGFSPLSMNGQAGGIEEIVRVQLGDFAREIAPQFDTQLEELEVKLPWNRTFEVEVGAKLS
ncbi:Protein of unknown function (DUF4127) [Abditibacterium utsteinense]|uniref:DUF4127 family protein n=1 Tax=Abditibacterium utsteinense TaxID=1960156 RepID=A0A2S8SR11_9BACT|nr:DUF4127 family protein [Abditibacterium utsteinense]PQV63230.1 Protein of unknown function (DUF4127) [Abditibacterium utsteinense]